MQNGWIKIHRKIQEKGYYKRSTYVHLWIHLLLNVNHEAKEFMWNGNIILIKEGQMITGRKELSEQTGIPESTIEDILNFLEKQHQIQQQKTTKYRLITIVNWVKHQNSDNKSNNRATTEQQQADTNKNVRMIRIKEDKDAASDIDNLLNEKGGIQYDYQFQGLEIYEKLNAPPNKKAECIRLAKKYPQYINPSLSFCLDYPNPALKWKMFLWKLNSLVKENK